MNSKLFDELSYYLPDFRLPKAFPGSNQGETNCLYLASCTENEFLLVDESFVEVSGYPVQDILEKGISWWFSIIHPEDIDQILNTIFQHCFFLPVTKRLNKPFIIEYRVKSPGGEWNWMQETKCIVSVSAEGKNELILGRLVDITGIKKVEASRLNKLLEEEGKTNPLLRAALPILHAEEKKQLNLLAVQRQYTRPKGVIMPTKREKEILQLIGQGYSTKQIAVELQISINTVETHRRHLLEKIQVKNSMELIKQTTNAFWLKAM